MTFLKAQGKGMIVGLTVAVTWAVLDFLITKIGLQMQHDYPSTFFAAAAGASLVYMVRCIPQETAHD